MHDETEAKVQRQLSTRLKSQFGIVHPILGSMDMDGMYRSLSFLPFHSNEQTAVVNSGQRATI